VTVPLIRPRRVLSALGVALRNDSIRRAELAWGAAISAEWMHFVALGVFAYEHGGASAVGVAGLVRLLPAAAVAPFATTLGDRFRRERFLLAIVLVGIAALAGSAAAFYAGSRVLVLACAAVFGLVATLVRPALATLLPSLARTPEELIASNAATATVESLGTLVGPVVAGVLVGVADPGSAFIGGAVVLAGAVVLLARVRADARMPVARGESDTSRSTIWAGFRVFGFRPAARLILGLSIAQAFVRGCLNIVIVVVVFRVLHAGASEVGYLTAAIGIGGLAGAFGATTLGRRRLATLFGLALVFWGAPIALIAPHPFFATAMVLLAVVGAANSIEDVAVITLLQRTIPDEILARSLGLFWGLAMGAVAIGSIAAPALIAVIGPRPAFVVVGAILPLLVLTTYRRLAELDRAAAPTAKLDLVDQIPMFAPLSIATKERVAERLVPVAVPAGQRVVRAGDEADGFYLVDDGEFEVDAGDVRARVREGGCFGEIAMLRDVPRTANVTAVKDSRVYVLDRDAFLAAVTGNAAAHAAGHGLADARLARAAGAP
jgi:MFS family permease